MKLFESRGDRFGIADGHEESIDAIANDLARPVRGGDHRYAAGHRFEHDERHALDQARKHEDIGLPIQRRQLFLRHVRGVPIQVGVLRIDLMAGGVGADEVQLRIASAKQLVAAQQVAHALALADLADEQHTEYAVRARYQPRLETFAIHPVGRDLDLARVVTHFEERALDEVRADDDAIGHRALGLESLGIFRR